MTILLRRLLVIGTFVLMNVAIVDVSRGDATGDTPPTLATAHPNTFFDPDPHHPWNQLYGAFFIRPGLDGKLYGLDEMDPLYWSDSHYLLDAPLHQQAIAVLDRFIQTGAAPQIKDALKRALLQRMLWALFDHWAHAPNMERDDNKFIPERRDLRTRLVKIMKAVALTEDEIQKLPHNYDLQVTGKTYPTEFDPDHGGKLHSQDAREKNIIFDTALPFLPATFFSNAEWVELDGTNYDLLAPVHVQAVSGRSAFHVLMSLPGGRAETLAYLKKLHDFQPVWTYDLNSRIGSPVELDKPYYNSELPQVPLLTKFALVRSAQFIDQDGEISSSPLVESVQIRVIRSILPRSGGGQDFAMFTLDQSKLMKGEGGLVPVGKAEHIYDMVLGGVDPLEGKNIRNRNPDPSGKFAGMESCFGCHRDWGIFTMNSYVEFFQPVRTLKPPDLREGGDAAWEATTWKMGQYDWGLLQAYWFEN